MTESRPAVFLSYASQDSEAAKRICEALRTAGVEVWFDQSELRGGDAWDAKIRRQIKECALFMPVISANTNSRPEGYFRLEWKLAVDRSHLLADDHPFLFPIAIDDVKDTTARVPDKFREVQWTRLRFDETPAELARRVSGLLSGSGTPAVTVGRIPPAHARPPEGSSTRKFLLSYWWVVFPLCGMLMALFPSLRAVRSPKRETRAPVTQPAPVTVPTAEPTPQLSEARRLAEKARGLIDLLDSTRDDLYLAEDLMKQALAKDNTDAEVWAAQAQVEARFVTRGFDRSELRYEATRTAQQRALRLDPRSFEARFASTMISAQYGAEAKETERILRELRAERPTDKRILRALGSIVSRQGRNEEATVIDDESATLPGGDPLAIYNKAWNYWYAGQPKIAQKIMRESIAQKPFSSSLLADCFYTLVLDGDLDGAKRALDRVPVSARSEDRGAIFAAAVYAWRREPDNVIASLRFVPRDWLDDNFFRGPRDLLAGDALATAGRMDAAMAAWRVALQVTEARAVNNPTDDYVVLSRAYLLASLGEKEKATATLHSWEQANGNGYSVEKPMPAIVRVIYMRLGRGSEVITHLMALFAGSNQRPLLYLSSAGLRLNPDWDPIRKDPAFPELLSVAVAAERAAEVRK